MITIKYNANNKGVIRLGMDKQKVMHHCSGWDSC